MAEIGFFSLCSPLAGALVRYIFDRLITLAVPGMPRQEIPHETQADRSSTGCP